MVKMDTQVSCKDWVLPPHQGPGAERGSIELMPGQRGRLLAAEAWGC